jgi:hypothetical protein
LQSKYILAFQEIAGYMEFENELTMFTAAPAFWLYPKGLSPVHTSHIISPRAYPLLPFLLRLNILSDLSFWGFLTVDYLLHISNLFTCLNYLVLCCL